MDQRKSKTTLALHLNFYELEIIDYGQSFWYENENGENDLQKLKGGSS